MTKKQPFLTIQQVKDIEKQFPTPFVIYDEKWIIRNMKYFHKSFEWSQNFQNYFALKACPNPTILQILKKIWSGVDCSSLWELVMSEMCWMTWENVMFTSNNTSIEEFKKAFDMKAIINFDDIRHIDFFKKHIWEMPKIACCRFNPWPLKQWNAIIWTPEEAKYWMRKDQIFSAYQQLKDLWVTHFWIHTMVASNELDVDYFIQTAKIIFTLVIEIEEKLWITFEFVNLWGGIWIPYKIEQIPVDLKKLSQWIEQKYQEIIWWKRKNPIKIVMECGRMITWPYWLLITKVEHVTEKYKQYVWVNASMQCLMRPALYWAYHHITVLWKENEENTHIYDVTWSLCENNDKFAINRKLPEIIDGDYLAIHDAWAHGTAMGFNYNAKLRPSELLLKEDGSIELIRRSETLSDYFSTLYGINGF